MRWLPFLLWLTAGCTSIPWWQHTGTQPEQRASVHGSVQAQDLLAGALPGVRVQAVLEGKVVAEAVTDERGRYDLYFEGALGDLCLASGRQQGKSTPHWPLKLLLTRDGFEPAESGTTVPRIDQPLPSVFMTRLAAPTE